MAPELPSPADASCAPARHRPHPPARALVIALVLGASFFAVEVAGSWLSGSLALLGDAGHMLADVFALLLSLFALKLAARPATPEKTYGYLRIEILSALVNGALLCVLALFIVHEAWQRFQDPRPVRADVMLAVAAAGLVANLAAAAVLHGATENLNIRGAYLHVLADALSSVGVLAGGAAMLWTGEMRIDTIIGALIGIAILWSAQRLVREAVDVLLEAIPPGVDPAAVSRRILEVDGVRGVHDLHIWSLTTGVGALSAHVLVGPESLAQVDRIIGEVSRTVERRFGIRHTTIQVETVATGHACSGPEPVL